MGFLYECSACGKQEVIGIVVRRRQVCPVCQGEMDNIGETEDEFGEIENTSIYEAKERRGARAY